MINAYLRARKLTVRTMAGLVSMTAKSSDSPALAIQISKIVRMRYLLSYLDSTGPR
jgi:hypothetical protein